MSYGNVYQANDVWRCKALGMSKEETINEIAGKLMARYSDIGAKQAKRIATRAWNANRRKLSHEWSWK